MNPFDQTKQILDNCSLIQVVSIQLHQFKNQHLVDPTLVIMTRSLKGPLIRELNQHRTDEEYTVHEPLWVNGIPVIFRPLQDHFMLLTNNRKKVETLL